MRRPRTLRARLTLGIAALVLIAIAAFGLVVYYVTAQRLSRSLDDSLRTNAAQAIAGTSSENGRLKLALDLETDATTGDMHALGLSVRLLNPDGTVVQQSGPYASVGTQPAELDAAREGASTFATRTDPTAGTRVKVLTKPLVEDGRTVGILQVTLSREPMLSTLRQLRLTLLVMAPVTAVLAALLGYLLARRVLAPLERITRFAGAISVDDLSSRLDLSPREDEVGLLASTFDDMLDRLDDSFHRERRFVADASHELRTPLAAVQAILTVTRERRRSAEEYERALDDIGAEAERLRTLVEALLELARADAGEVGEWERVDLSILLPDVCASLEVLAHERGLKLTSGVPDHLVVNGDADALVRLFVNVLENAIKYTDEGVVALTASAEDGCVRAAIADTGPGIADDDLPHVFERFYRGDPSRAAGGTGLGLSIARQIATAHGGHIELTSESGSGTTVTVTLPAAI